MIVRRGEILARYEKFSHSEHEKWDRRTPNYFNRVNPERIDSVERAGSFVFPQIYRAFLIEIGSGVYKEDSQGNVLEFSGNGFLSPEEVLQYVRKETPEWNMDPTYLEPGDIPFFHVGDELVLIFRQNDLDRGAVYQQYGKTPRLATFELFLEFLYDDVNVYRSPIFRDGLLRQ